MKEHPDNYDAELLLRLYDLRRETRLRQARDWYIREFRAKTFEEYSAECPPGSEHSAFFRMTVTYWDMAASIVNHGLIKEEFFFENASEFWVVWDKARAIAPVLREKFKNPMVWKNLETLAGKYEEWMSKHAPEALELTRQRIQGMSAKKPD